MAFGFDVVPDVFELAVGSNEKSTANDSQERAAEEFLHAARAVGFDVFQIGIAEEIEVKFLFGFEGGLRFDGVAAHSQNNHAKLIELLFCVAKLGRFRRSTRSVGFGIEKQHDAFANEVR